MDIQQCYEENRKNLEFTVAMEIIPVIYCLLATTIMILQTFRRNDHGSVSYKPSENGTTDINRNLQGLVTSSSPVILSNGIIKLGVRPSGGLFARGGTIATAKIAFWDC